MTELLTLLDLVDAQALELHAGNCIGADLDDSGTIPAVGADFEDDRPAPSVAADINQTPRGIGADLEGTYSAQVTADMGTINPSVATDLGPGPGDDGAGPGPGDDNTDI